ncbi:unnamed protein product [Calypogeia fissa]
MPAGWVTAWWSGGLVVGQRAAAPIGPLGSGPGRESLGAGSGTGSARKVAALYYSHGKKGTTRESRSEGEGGTRGREKVVPKGEQNRRRGREGIDGTAAIVGSNNNSNMLRRRSGSNTTPHGRRTALVVTSCSSSSIRSSAR